MAYVGNLGLSRNALGMAEKYLNFDQPSRDLNKRFKRFQDQIDEITSSKVYKETTQALRDGKYNSCYRIVAYRAK